MTFSSVEVYANLVLSAKKFGSAGVLGPPMTSSNLKTTEAANGGVLQINCSAPARKLKLE